MSYTKAYMCVDCDPVFKIKDECPICGGTNNIDVTVSKLKVK